MSRGIHTVYALVAFLSAASGCFAAGVQKGAAMQVKANSIWFQAEATLAHWQELKKSGNTTAVSSFEDEVLVKRDASQFSNQLPVKILKVEPKAHQVEVEMTIEGRMHGSTWWVDADAVAR